MAFDAGQYKKVDAEDIPFPDDSFGAVLSNHEAASSCA